MVARRMRAVLLVLGVGAALLLGSRSPVVPAHAQSGGASGTVPIARFYGTVTSSTTGQAIPNASISASTNSSVGIAFCGTGSSGNQGNYFLDIQLVAGCTIPGSTVNFTVNGVTANNTGTLPSVQGSVVKLNLSVPTHASPQTSTSPSWSGYDLRSGSNGAYTEISATWTVPSVGAGAGTGINSSAAWVGIDDGKDGSGDLIQVGTIQDYSDCPILSIFQCSSKYQPEYAAFWQIGESATPTIVSGVSPGDSIYAEITFFGASEWWIELDDNTQGTVLIGTTQYYGGPLTSAEWIVEHPQSTELASLIAPDTGLANYGEVTFSSMTINNGAPSLGQPWGRLVMVDANSQAISTPSESLTQTTSAIPAAAGFSVAYGSQAP